MSLSGFGRSKQQDENGVATPPPSSNAGLGNLTAFIDQGSEFEGKLSFKDTVRIDGRFAGEISSENTLIVGESGEIEAAIHSPSVVISGAVVGDVFATRQLVLHKTARLQGDIHTPSLIVEEGAVVNGAIKMGRPEAVAKSGGKPGGPEAKASNGGNANNGNNNNNNGGSNNGSK